MRFVIGGLLAVALALGAPQSTAAGEGGKSEVKHHHDLRGVITKVEAEKNEFEIKTDAGRVVLCLINEDTTVKRGTETIRLKDVKPGDRAFCHCAALRNGRHYSTSLRVEEKEKAED